MSPGAHRKSGEVFGGVTRASPPGRTVYQGADKRLGESDRAGLEFRVGAVEQSPHQLQTWGTLVPELEEAGCLPGLWARRGRDTGSFITCFVPGV